MAFRDLIRFRFGGLYCSMYFALWQEQTTTSTSYLPATTESVAQALEANNPNETISILYRILDNPSSSSEALRIKEQAITNLSDLLRQENRTEVFAAFLLSERNCWLCCQNTRDIRPPNCLLQRNRSVHFSGRKTEARLAAVLMENKEYSGALALLTGLVKELRRLEDKLLMDIDLLEGKLHFS